MNVKDLDRLADQAYDLQVATSNLHDYIVELEITWEDLGRDRGSEVFNDDFLVMRWEADLDAAVELETKMIPQELEQVRKLMHGTNVSYVKVLGA